MIAALDLSGRWLISPDDPDHPRRAGWWLNGAAPGGWRSIDLPCAWQTVLGDFHGCAWLRRRVDVPAEARRAGCRAWLRFDSVATDLHAWVNGLEMGRHVGDWVPFQIEVSSALGAADDLDIVLRVDEIRAEPVVPPALQEGHITKGFHDVISMQHGGIWLPLHLGVSGPLAARPDGVSVRADAETGSVRIQVEVEPRPAGGGRLEARIVDRGGITVGSGSAPIRQDQDEVSLTLAVARPERWSPHDPALYRALVTLSDDTGALSERREVRFGFRTIRTEGRTILLNGAPLFIRGVLDWGHVPEAIAPAPTPEETRRTFARLRAMGFNCVCHCMWYPPRHVFEIADETGMLIWQEHPVWQSRMAPQDLPEYRRLYRAFLSRDRLHPSVVIVSAACEHPSFDRELAAWWWRTARDKAPHALLQVQTAFFKWSDPGLTDLHDEHTYDNSNRWVGFVEDLQEHLATLEPKPFVMGESILFTSWPDVAALQARCGSQQPWWAPRALAHMSALESSWSARYGEGTVARFREQGDRFHLLGRKFQVEQLRRFASSAGVVMNHLRDVPQCQCGLRDDLGRWRFEPEACRPWLADRAILLWTPEQRRGFCASPAAIECRVAVSNFGAEPFEGSVRIAVNSRAATETDPFTCRPGHVASVPLAIPGLEVTHPVCLHVEAAGQGAHPNSWDLWVLPARQSSPRACRFAGWPFTSDDGALDKVERGYSRGWGLPVRTWRSLLPDPALIAPDLSAWEGSSRMDRAVRALVTHRLTGPILDWMLEGGSVILLASKAPGGLGTVYESLFGQVPLIIEERPLDVGDSNWMLDLLVYDLIRRSGRVIPVEELGIADQIDPLVRAVYTHDQKDRVRFFDQLFTTRVGKGLLIASSLDHSEAAGQWLLHLLIEYAVAEPRGGSRWPRAELDPALVRRWTRDAQRA